MDFDVFDAHRLLREILRTGAPNGEARWEPAASPGRAMGRRWRRARRRTRAALRAGERAVHRHVAEKPPGGVDDHRRMRRVRIARAHVAVSRAEGAVGAPDTCRGVPRPK